MTEIFDVLEEGLAVQHHGVIGNTLFVSVNDRKYGYQPKHSEDPNYVSIGDMEHKFKGMLKHSSGKALAWLKKRSNLASGSVKGQSKIVTDGLEFSYSDEELEIFEQTVEDAEKNDRKGRFVEMLREGNVQRR